MSKSTIDSLDNVTPTRAGAPDESKLIGEMELALETLDEQIQTAGIIGADVTLTDHEIFAGYSGVITWTGMCNRRKDVEVCYVALHTDRFGFDIPEAKELKDRLSAFTDLPLVKINAVSSRVGQMHLEQSRIAENVAKLYAQQDKS